jgi:hypothetical protein
MEKVADNKGIPLDRAAAAGNASGHANHAPASWGDIIKNNVGKMPDAPAPSLVPAADAVKKEIDDRSLNRRASDHYDDIGGSRNNNDINFERALETEGGVLKDGLGRVTDKVLGKIEDLGGSVRGHVLPSNDKK